MIIAQLKIHVYTLKEKLKYVASCRLRLGYSTVTIHKLIVRCFFWC